MPCKVLFSSHARMRQYTSAPRPLLQAFMPPRGSWVGSDTGDKVPNPHREKYTQFFSGYAKNDRATYEPRQVTGTRSRDAQRVADYRCYYQSQESIVAERLMCSMRRRQRARSETCSCTEALSNEITALQAEPDALVDDNCIGRQCFFVPMDRCGQRRKLSHLCTGELILRRGRVLNVKDSTAPVICVVRRHTARRELVALPNRLVFVRSKPLKVWRFLTSVKKAKTERGAPQIITGSHRRGLIELIQ